MDLLTSTTTLADPWPGRTARGIQRCRQAWNQPRPLSRRSSTPRYNRSAAKPGQNATSSSEVIAAMDALDRAAHDSRWSSSPAWACSIAWCSTPANAFTTWASTKSLGMTPRQTITMVLTSVAGIGLRRRRDRRARRRHGSPLCSADDGPRHRRASAIRRHRRSTTQLTLALLVLGGRPHRASPARCSPLGGPVLRRRPPRCAPSKRALLISRSGDPMMTVLDRGAGRSIRQRQRWHVMSRGTVACASGSCRGCCLDEARWWIGNT